ncbi:hypothetical protein TNCV_4264911 [Trichonephila clavipes]|nr:hypothetical protein TNCV_4264911 [Trichonephila clavipes]
MSEEGLVEHIIAQLEPQLLEYVEIRNPTSRSQFLKMIAKYEDRYLRRNTQGPSNNNSERRDCVENMPTIVGIEIGKMQEMTKCQERYLEKYIREETSEDLREQESY